MTAHERIAKKIGMRRDESRRCWTDPGTLEKVYDSLDALPSYLLTGDWPLRVMAAYKISVEINRSTGLWMAWTYTQAGAWRQSPWRDDPAAAIIALAEKIEGEGRE